MDILSRLFDEMHLQQVQYISVHASGAWQLEQAQQDYLTFIVVISGEIYLAYDKQLQVIAANNMVMLTSQDRYICQSDLTLSNTAVREKMPAHSEGQINLVINNEKPESQLIHKKQAAAKFIIVRSHFDVDMAKPLLSALPTSLPPSTQQHSAYNDVVNIGLQFFQLEARLDRPGKITMLARLASMLMIECIREYVEQLEMTPAQNINDIADTVFNAEDSGNWLAALKDPYLSKTLYLMHRYPEEVWTIQRLAKESGLSRSGLNERFRKLVGMTPQLYFSQYRLRLAARFLRQEQYSINKISELVGYASDTSFHGAFKRRYGQSPSHYRRAYIESNK